MRHLRQLSSPRRPGRRRSRAWTPASPPSTPPTVYARGRAEQVWRRWRGTRSGASSCSARSYFPVGPGAQRPRAVSQARVLGVRSTCRSAGWAPTTSTSTRARGARPRDAAGGDEMQAFATSWQGGRGTLIGVSEWRAEELAGSREALGRRARCASCPTSRSTRRSTRLRGGGHPERRSTIGISQIVFSPIARGLLTGKYFRPGSPAGGAPGRPTRRAAATSSRARCSATECAHPGAATKPDRRRLRSVDGGSWRWPGCWPSPNVAAAIVGASRPEQVAENVQGVRRPAGRRRSRHRFDEVLAPVAQTDPALTRSPRR